MEKLAQARLQHGDKILSDSTENIRIINDQYTNTLKGAVTQTKPTFAGFSAKIINIK
ncbi:hypothetical protein [Aphanothece sacrum]|uniref:WD40 repeat-containing protein n=1 Tax=Aphanothece sacrum FPU1 TaxID=1920663 RepID=A0A401IK54_APHSA|nr:hypothetical protein [Aphanothece sacrum]GBF81695.1 WD40 repeat-containing protein [Aphanothece sacrum FPU1]